jgi:hypothetical protein
MGLSVSREGSAVEVEVAVSNVGAGHRLPSGTAGRSLILEVDARHRGSALLLWRAAPRALGLGPLSTDVSRYRLTALRSEPVEVAARLVLMRAGAPPLTFAEAAAVGSDTGEEP